MQTIHKILFSVALLGLLNFALVIVFGDKGLVELVQQRSACQRQLADNRRLEQQNVMLFRRIGRLKNDPVYIDSVARQQLLMVRPDEVVITLPAVPAAGKEP